MKTFLTLSLLSLFLGSAMAEDKHSQHHSKSEEEKKHAVKSLSLNNGKKWDVDQTMKDNMEAIHTQLKKTSALKNASAKDYSELSNVVSTAAQNIARDCKMEQKKDETFHTVLGDLLAASEDLKDSKKAKHALEQLHHALSVYTKFFDHSFSK